ncbi:MAG TPA: PAS domain S-box protein, partial [Gammaproteobacteria bacterium]|nr:PAS domain S-box protein [Gammaproteobacteria bacterium]
RLLPTAAPGLVGRLLTEVLPADTSLRQGLERLAGGETPGWQQEVAVTADGEGVRWLEVKATPRQDPGGAVDGLSLVIDEVTERKASQRQEAEAAAEQLRQRESFVQSVLGSFPDMVFLKTTEGVYVDCNDEFGRLVGQPPDAIRGQTDYDLFDGETADFFRFYDECMLARGVGRHNEEWVHYPDGSEALLDMLKTPYRDAGGTIQGVIGIGRDITDRHRAREQLRTSEVRNRAIVNTMAEGMVLFGADGVILAANPAACDILEVSEEELLGRAAWSGAWRTLSEDGAPFPQAEHPAMVTLRTGEGVSGVTMGLERADGEVRWISVNAEPLAGESGAVATFSDITQRHQAEKALAEKEAHYRELVENQTQFVERFLPDTTVLFANQAAAAFFGTTPEAMQGRRWLEALPAEEQAIAREHLATFTPEAPIASLENSLVRADGEVRWTLWTNRAFFDDAGRITHFQSVGIDITERKRAEQDRDRLLQILEATPDFVGMGDARLQPVYYNRAALAMLGVNAIDEVQADDIEGQHPSWAWRRLHEEAFPSARRDGLWQGETALVTAEGREIPVSQVLIAMPGDNGEISHYATIMRDLSAQKEREATLRQLTEILEASPDFISMARPDGAVLYVNEGGRRLLDLPEAPTAGASTQANWSEEEAGEWGHPDWASHKIQAEGIPAALAHGYWEGETALVDAAGRERPVSQLILAHRDDAGDTVRLSTVMRDISRHKELEARLQQRQAALRRLQEVTADPERTTENKLTGLLHLGTDYFGLAHGVLSRFEGGSCLVQQAVHREGAVAAVPDCDAAATDCAGPLAGAGATGTAQGGAEAIPAAACYPVRGMEAFLGIPIHV